jgi:hypothetical protein
VRIGVRGEYDREVGHCKHEPHCRVPLWQVISKARRDNNHSLELR